jgi:hypothetical protein
MGMMGATTGIGAVAGVMPRFSVIRAILRGVPRNLNKAFHPRPVALGPIGCYSK